MKSLTMNRFWMVICCLVVVFTSIGYSSIDVDAKARIIDRGESGSDVTWTLDSEGTLTVKGDGDIQSGENWNGDKKYIKKVVIKKGVTGVGTNAFYFCQNLKKVTLPKGLEKIDRGAFMGCPQLKKVKMASGLLEIESNAFKGCTKIKKLTIPSSVNAIGDYIVYGCTHLTDINLKCTDVDDIRNFSGHAFQQKDNYRGTIYLHGDMSVARYLDNLHAGGHQGYLKYK